jgi:hypothetical protein
VYHDLKHAGILSVVEAGDEETDAELELHSRAVSYTLAQGALTHPSEVHDPNAGEDLKKEVAALCESWDPVEE